jgi:hypothetical protein
MRDGKDREKATDHTFKQFPANREQGNVLFLTAIFSENATLSRILTLAYP